MIAKFEFEEVVISLHAKEKQSTRELQSFLLKRKYEQMDDFYFLPRKDIIKDWEFDEVASINLFLNDNKVCATQEDLAKEDTQWNELNISYFLASLPRKYIKVFVKECETLCRRFGMIMIFNGQSVPSSDVKTYCNQLADKVTTEMGDPGSEIVAILIQMEYQSF